MPLLQPGSRSPIVQARLARELAQEAVAQGGETVALAQQALDTAETASTQAAAASSVAADVQAKAATLSAFQRVRDSYIVPGNAVSALDAGDGTAAITIANHSRVYLDGGSVSVQGATITGLSLLTFYAIRYDDPTFAGGAVAYSLVPSEDEAIASVEHPSRHLVASVTTPAAGGAPSAGGGGRPYWKPGLDPDDTGNA